MPVYTVRELAANVAGEVQGDGEAKIEGISDLAGAGPGRLSFLGNPRYRQQARRSGAAAILVAPDENGEGFASGVTLIRVASPSLAFSKIAQMFAPAPVAYTPGVHPTAVVAPDALLGEGVAIEPHAVVGAGARIGARTIIGAGTYVGPGVTVGEDCLFHPRVVVREHCVIGNRVVLYSGAVIGSDGFGYELKEGRYVKIPQIGIVQLDDDVEIGANSTVDRARFGRTWIKQGAKIDNLVMIAHNVVIGAHTVIVGQVGISGSTEIGKYVTLAGQVGLAGHIHVGDQAIITAQSGVAKDVPAGAVLSGRYAVPRRESLKIDALTQRLPEIWDRLKALEEKSGGEKA
jgi:UDP-3-O-[3-hydroxymyristoyl] glucosamine N-acyltransferase